MRLWHRDIIRFLPKGQLVSQWKELGSIYKNQNKHILKIIEQKSAKSSA